ncbi:MAG: B12-binding domain-containing radical SAM protein [Myxococcales bacterium]|nr:B12-binding domain-containing radical SAM protein [Myxococcales bacterium]
MSRRALLEAIERRRASERGLSFRAGNRRMAVVYPSPYRAGMSSLGFQRIVAILREHGIAAERAFLPDDVAAWQAAGQSVVTYETGTPLEDFPLLAVSFAYEAELVGLLQLLHTCRIRPLREERTEGDPMLLLGGPISMASPAFLEPFVDAALLGEGEDVVVPAVAGFFDAETREGWLDTVSALPGGWIPERDGARFPIPAQATDAHLPARSGWLAPEAELSDMFLLEGERGCHRMCTFCVMRRTTNGGMRLVSSDRILELIPEEARKVGLVGAAISDHPELPALLGTLVASGRQVSVSSLRADRVARRPEIAQQLRASGARTLTTASDGASERLRKSMKKGTTETHLLACGQQAGELGFAVFKLYMMIGVPDETDDDIDELIRFTRELAQACRPSRLALGVAPFVAKRNTPLDGLPFAGIKAVQRRMKRLERGLRGAAEVRPVSARWAWIEHELAQGGPESGLAMMHGLAAGGTFGDYKRALAAVAASTRRPWARFEAPMVDPEVRRAGSSGRRTGTSPPG